MNTGIEAFLQLLRMMILQIQRFDFQQASSATFWTATMPQS